jgi:hypothetical protein
VGDGKTIREVIVVADTGPILHLHWIDASAWALPPLPIHVVEEVWQEVLRLDPSPLKDPRLVRVTSSKEQVSLLEPFRLDEGERELPGRGRLHIERSLIQKALDALKQSP